MARSNYRSSIPVEAVEKVEQKFGDGSKRSSLFILNGQLVGLRGWDEEGALESECGIRNNVKQGRQYQFHRNGQVQSMMPYRNGILHGTCKQWSSHDGRLLITYKLVNGVGFLLWCDDAGILLQESYSPSFGEFGYTRLWKPDEQTIMGETQWAPGKRYHGVQREWNSKGRPKRGFPRFYVDSKVVTKQEYFQKCATDASLRPYTATEDQPFRKLPAEYLAQLKQRTRLTK